MDASITLTFYNETKIGRVTDTTDYTALGINLSTFNAKGLGTIYFNGEAIVTKNTVGDPLINLASGATYFEFDLELDSNGLAANGTYQVVYSNRFAVISPALVDFSVQSTSTLLTDGVPELTSILEAGNELTLDDASTVTVESAVTASGNVLITIEETTLTTQGSFTFDVTNETFNDSYTYTGCTLLTVDPQASYDCDNGDNGTFTFYDNTDFSTQTLVSRSMIGSPPTWATEITAVTTSNQSYTINRLATGTWTVALTNVITYTQNDGLILIYTATATIEVIVTCAGTLCGLNACIESLRAAHEAQLEANPTSIYQKYVDNVALYYIKAKNYKECGEYDLYRQQVALIQAQLDAAPCECACCDDSELRYIYNTSSTTQAQIDVILEQLNVLENVTYNKVLFDSPVVFTDDVSYYPYAITLNKTFEDLSAITIPKEYFDTAPNGYAKKFVMIELTNYTSNGDSIQIEDQTPNRLYTGVAPDGTGVTQRHRIKLTTAQVSSVVVGMVSGESFQVDNDSPNTALDGYFATVFDAALWDLTADLVLNITSGASNANCVITECKITAYGYE